MRKSTKNTNCPFCLSPIEKGEEKVRCPVCGVMHHAECWKVNGKCSVYGCDGWQAWSGSIGDKISPKIEAEIDISGSNLGVMVSNARRGAKVKEEPALCIKCGRPVGPEEVTCRNCRRRNIHYLEGCFGPSVLLLGVGIGIVTLMVKALI